MINIGVDWAVKEGDKTCVVFARHDEDGTVTVVGQLRGEAAEYVVQLTEIMGLVKELYECDEVDEWMLWRKIMPKIIDLQRNKCCCE